MNTRMKLFGLMAAGMMLQSAAAQAEPSEITGIGASGPALRLDIQSDVGVTNQIEYKTNLNQMGWLVITNVTATQTNFSYSDMAFSRVPMRFYRVAVVAPPGMALIPSGTFTMGNCMNPNEGNSAELPLHQVFVSACYMDTNLVRFDQWTAVYQW